MTLPYGIESNPEVAAKFLVALALHQRHSHITPFVHVIESAKNDIPL
jgi:hypothetical protein